MSTRIIIVSLTVALCACTTTYHPEYHPVSVSHVVVASPQAQPVIVATPQEPLAPFEFFDLEGRDPK